MNSLYLMYFITIYQLTSCIVCMHECREHESITCMQESTGSLGTGVADGFNTMCVLGIKPRSSVAAVSTPTY